MEKQRRYINLVMIMSVVALLSRPVNGESLMGGHLDNQEEILPDSSDSSLHYRIANVVPFAFNGGQPFSLEKDPVTGQIDFDKAPPLKALNYTGSYGSDSNDEAQIADEESENDANKDNDMFQVDSLSDETSDDQQIPNEINPYSPSFHDFLHLPVRYSNHEKYTNDKYPLISSSYANTKVQGGSTSYNAYTINHKNYHHAGGKASTSQSYSMTRRPYTPRSTTTKKPTTSTTTTTTTTEAPTTTSTTPSTTTTNKPTTTEPITTWKPNRDRYDVHYEEEAMLPIEKMQVQSDQPFGSLDANAYEDVYDDYSQLDVVSSTMSSPSSTTTSTTTQAPQTSMPLDPVTVNSENDRPQDSLNINGAGGYSTDPITHPSFSGLVVESSSNVIVPPDQDTISFVLGNRQNVQGSFYAHGSAIPESPYGDVAPVSVSSEESSVDLSIGRPSETLQLPFSNQLPTESNDNDKWWFNSESEKSQVTEKPKEDKVDVSAGYRVAFPTSIPDETISAEVSTSTMNPTTPPPSIEDGPSVLSEILTPPAVDGQRPLYYPHHHPYHHPRPEAPNRGQRPPIGSVNVGYKIRPPSLDLNLPNILPQFRPNVKTSQRRGSEAIGTMIVQNPPKYPHRLPMRPPPPPSPPAHRPPQRRVPDVSHLQRLNPPPPPLPPPVHTLRLPTPAALVSNLDSRGQGTENVPVQKEIPNRRNIIPAGEGQLDERNRLVPGSQVLKSRLNDEDLEKLSAEAPSLPPRAPFFPKRKTGNASVATLQMIQQHQVRPDDFESDDDVEGDREPADRRVDETPVYVVYPVKGSMDIRPDAEDSSEKESLHESVVIGTHGPQRPLPPETLSQQNDEEVDVILSRPAVQMASDFPYPPAIPNPSVYLSQLQEKPLLVPIKHQPQMVDEPYDVHDSSVNNQDRDTSINLIPYLQDHQPFPIKSNIISTTLQLFGGQSSSSPAGSTATPIAYVYTPTTRAPVRRQNESFERNPILLPSQQPSSSSSSAPSPQSFMAPFVASISADSPSKNGWSVVTGGPFVEKPETVGKLDRNDENLDGKNNEPVESSTTTAFPSGENKKSEEKDVPIDSDFDANNFKPQLFGGFQPFFKFPSETEMPSESGTPDTMMEKPRAAKEFGP